MNNKSYAKCRLCEYKGGCAFNHNGDQELCDLNVTHLDLAEHDKQIRDEVIDRFMNLCDSYCHFNTDKHPANGYVISRASLLDIAEKMKGE